MRMNDYFDDISLLNFKKDLQGYRWNTAKQDLLAGFNVALMTVPQAIAYAILAGIPLVCSLLASIFSSAFASLFGSCRYLVVAQSNAIAMLIQSGISELLFTHFRESTGAEKELIAVQLMIQLSFLIGLIQLLAAGCRLGRLTQFVSHSVVVGYVVGTALAIAINQAYSFSGVPQEAGMFSLYHRSLFLITHLHWIHLPTLIVGALSLILLLSLRRYNPRIPAAGMMLVISATLLFFLQDDEGLKLPFLDLKEHWRISLVGDLGAIGSLIPEWSVPNIELTLINKMLPLAFAVALLSVLETTSVSRSVAANSGERLSVNQEIFGVGIGNLTSALVGAVPVAGSASRSILNYQSGAQTRFSAVLSALCVAIIMAALSFFVTRIPLASLSAFLLFIAWSIVNKPQLLLCCKATGSDAFVLWTTIAACLFFSFDVAFYIGVVFSIILYLKKAAMPQFMEYEVDTTGKLMRALPGRSLERKPIRVIKIEGELFFGAADLFQTTLKTIAEDDTSTRVIVLQLKNARDIDATTCLALERLHDYLKKSGRCLLACGVMPSVWEVLSSSGLVEVIGKKNLFFFDERQPQLCMQKALWRARQIVAEEASVPIQPPTPVRPMTESQPAIEPLSQEPVPVQEPI